MTRAPPWPSSPGWNINTTRAGQLSPPVGQQTRRPDEHGHVGVVPAGVHLAVDSGGEVQAGVLGHLEGVHVGAQQRGRSGPLAVDDSHHRGGRGTRGGVEAQPGEGVEDRGLGVRQVQAGLRAGVDASAQRHRVVEPTAGIGHQLRIDGRGRRVGWRGSLMDPPRGGRPVVGLTGA